MASIDRSFESSFPHGRFGAAKIRPPALEPTLPTDAPRDRLRDLTALALLAGVLFLVASLATYHPADPPGARAFPPHARAVNACGFIGSATAGLLYEWLGLGAWFVTALLVGLDVALLRRRDLADLPLKTVGAVLATGGVCTLLAMFLPPGSRGRCGGPAAPRGRLAPYSRRAIWPQPALRSWLPASLQLVCFSPAMPCSCNSEARAWPASCS